MDPQSLDLQGVSRGKGRNEGRPFQGIDTVSVFPFGYKYFRRNEGRPIQGIDTSSSIVNEFYTTSVEMKVAPFRALILI